ncbi:MAG: hypothetical protein WCE52_13520 [Candidatus Acidiferrum sp.]
MKAQANGVLNVSTLDGWWDEAWQIGLDAGAEVDLAIGKGESYTDPGHQEQIEAEDSLGITRTRNRSGLLRTTRRWTAAQVD